MTCAAILTELGDIALRGNASVMYRTISLARPRNEKEAITLDLTNWLNGATLSSRTIEEFGTNVTDNGVSSNVWSLLVDSDGYADLFAVASDGREWSGSIHMIDTANGPYRDRYS